APDSPVYPHKPLAVFSGLFAAKCQEARQHTHRSAASDVTSIQGYPLPIIATGSLCAGPKQRPESTPRSYNVIEVMNDELRVHVRQKKERGKHWVPCVEFGDKQEPRSWYKVSLSNTADHAVQVDPRIHRQSSQIVSPSPFSAFNAKTSRRDDVLRDYVWTTIADDAQSDLPQIIIGTRGSGKTALLLTLTLESQLRRDGAIKKSFPRIGLYCPMKVHDVSAFNGKGLLSIDDRKTLFNAAICTTWAGELVENLGKLERWSKREGVTTIAGEKCASSLAAVWGISLEENTLSSLRLGIRTLRDRVLDCLSLACTDSFSDSLRSIKRVPLLRGGLGPLEDAASELKEFDCLSKTRWTVLFDEIEFLNEWQQACVYEYMSNPSSHTSCKLATLPYAHSLALSKFSSVLVIGEDYGELSVMLGSDSEFERIAIGLWESRLRESTSLSLKDVWPAEEYVFVIERITGLTETDLENKLIEDLPVERRNKAKDLKANDRTSFGSEFKRKYQEPFRFRLAKRFATTDKNTSIPLYWGWQQMLKACGKNPRQFLRLAQTCWTKYWSTKGIRPLSAEEQYAALSQWAGGFAARCSALPHKGQELQCIIERIVRKLQEQLHGPKFLKNEHFSVRIDDCHQDQAEAIAIGIAYGFLVPKSTQDQEGRPMFPATDIVMRLGYPVAVANRLPLRQGEVLKMSNLRQIEMPWWSE
ncbi:MAG: hypothetical protein JXA30_19050, partial [Deltaproteobacteria bacterium]|nr:hypothetical protein [Deltaproteobacteria bacterium]